MTGAAVLAEALPYLMGAVLLSAALALFQRPIQCFARLAVRTGAGLLCLNILAPVGNLLGASLGINLFNALILGIFGAPGLGLLLLLKWALR